MQSENLAPVNINRPPNQVGQIAPSGFGGVGGFLSNSPTGLGRRRISGSPATPTSH